MLSFSTLKLLVAVIGGVVGLIATFLYAYFDGRY